MKKKIMLLIAIIPLVFMLTIFSVGKAVSVIVSIPVSGIKITTQNDDGVISLDMATYSDDLFITAEVFPSNAKNKNYSVKISAVGDETPADISVEDDGKLSLHGVGRAKLTVTSNENAFTDSVIINVVSSKVIDFTPALTANGGNAALIPSNESDVDFETSVSSGDLMFSATVTPSTLSESPVKWYSEDGNIITVNEYLGKARASLSGSVIVTAVNDDGIKGKIEKKIKINVDKAATVSGVTVNGGENVTVICPSDSDKATFLVEIPAGKTSADIFIRGANVADYSLSPVNGSSTKFIAEFTFVLAADCFVDVTVNGTNYNRTEIKFSEYAFGVYTGYHLSDSDTMYHKNGVTATYIAAGNVYDGNVSYRWTSSDESVLTVVSSGYTAQVTAHKTGSAKLSVTALKNGVAVGENIVKEVTVVTPVTSVDFTANAVTHGIADILAVGDTAVSGKNYVQSFSELSLRALSNATAIDFDTTAFLYSSSDVGIATPSATLTKLRVNIIASGKVTFTSKWIYADYFGENVSSSITFKAVKGGVNVSNYADLKKATDDGKPVVLTSSVYLGAKTSDYNTLRGFANTIPTTWDWQYYENQGLSRPDVLYLIEFKNDVYGNGFEINGDYITQAKDSTGNPILFKGPLDFVAISVAAVKGQDNIVFLARTAGVTIDNVVLKGCSDKSLITENGDFDLSLLNFVGTTLEIAESVSVKNCRVSNGRTVTRIFGGGSSDGKSVVNDVSEVNAEDERINVKIESCILSNAREFIVKTGSNRALMAVGDANTAFGLQKLPREGGGTYDCYDAANGADEYFYNKYVTADITLKNCVLATSGLFSIGMETHFGGEMLSGAKGSTCPNKWYKLAATSFACALRLEGEVKMLDWKKLSNVDSSTLIETAGDLGENKQFLQLDISAMIKKVSANDSYNDIVSKISGEDYVHGGIAVYGGGYNYSYVDFSGLSANTDTLPSYKISLSILAEGEPENSMLYLQGKMLPGAAGPSDFLFYMYNNGSKTDYNSQTNAVSSGEAYKIPSAE